MLVTVIIFLRESLEAALLISMLLAISHNILLDKRWIFLALIGGLVCGGVTATYLGMITNLFEGVGQEILNATLLMIIVILIALVNIVLAPLPGKRQKSDAQLKYKHFMPYILGLAVAVAITHEGMELIIYTSAYSQAHASNMPLALGAIVGMGIGASVGSIIYYTVIMLPRKYVIKLFITVLILIASGMSLQASIYLQQAGLIPSLSPLWNSTLLVSEDSLTGQLLYALIGYEATPDAVQLGVYTTTFVCILMATGFSCYKRKYELDTDK